MRKMSCAVMAFMVLTLCLAAAAQAKVDVNLNIGVPVAPAPVAVVPAAPPPPPPPVYAEPSVVLIPGTYVYYAPGLRTDILFYHGVWYNQRDGRWFSGRTANGPWYVMPRRNVPHALVSLPPDYRRVAPGHARISYGELTRNWQRWERERHWDRHAGPRGEGFKGGPGPGPGPDRRGFDNPGKGHGGPHDWDRGGDRH
jgi:hypothetical protein